MAGETTEKTRPWGATRTVCGPLRHPLRARILEAANEGDISPIEFVRGCLEWPLDGLEEKQALSNIAYHFRELVKADCLEVVDKIPKRGSLEHVHRGKARVQFTNDEFAQLSSDARRALSETAIRGLIARVEGAIRARTFDRREDRHLTWTAMHLDEDGWAELVAALDRCHHEVESIRQDAEARLAETDEPAIPATVGVLGFESPPHRWRLGRS